MRHVAAVLALAGALLGPRATAAAQAPWQPASVRQAQARQQAAALAERLEAMEGVVGARAQVRLPDPLSTALDAPPPRPRIEIQLRVTSATQRPQLTARAIDMARAVVSDARPTDVHVRWLALDVPPRAPFARVGPFAVEADSAGWLRGTLWTLLATSFVLAALLLRYARRGGDRGRLG